MNAQLTSALRRSRLIVIDENAYHRGIMGGTLRSLQVGSTENAESITEAMERIRQVPPTIILFEWALTGIDGIEFTKLVRQGKYPVKRDTALIIVTSRSTREAVETARRAGVDEYLIKPFTTQALELRLNAVLFNRREFVTHSTYIGPCRRRKFLMDYAGPKRRDLDELNASNDGESAQVKARKSMARTKVQEAQALNRATVTGDRSMMGQLLTTARIIERLSREIDDALLMTAAASLVSYIAAAGPTPHYDAKVVEAHLDALGQLLNLTSVQQEMRETVASALHALVKKKLAR